MGVLQHTPELIQQVILVLIEAVHGPTVSPDMYTHAGLDICLLSAAGQLTCRLHAPAEALCQAMHNTTLFDIHEGLAEHAAKKPTVSKCNTPEAEV